MTRAVFLGVGMGDLMTGRTAAVSGLSEDDDGALKVYVGHRHKGLYLLVDDPVAQEAIRDAWGYGGHVLIPLPEAGQVFADAATPHRGRA